VCDSSPLCISDSICEIGIRQQQFAEQSVEFLVDMLQDEIDQVRVNSLHSLRKIASRVSVTHEQLMTVLALLEDKTFVTRSAVHRLLATVQLCNIACVQLACTALLLSLTQYPADRLSVYRALGSMGGNHPQFCALIVDQVRRG
jgi:integrator complex subunit 4